MRTRDTDGNGTLDETLYALTDITYDVVALADSTGAVVERFLYDPYGKSKVLDANFVADANGVSDYDWEYRFTSREWDKETGLDYFRARFYASNVGKFVNRDPLEYPDGYNMYAGYFVPHGLDPRGTDICDDYFEACMLAADDELIACMDEASTWIERFNCTANYAVRTAGCNAGWVKCTGAQNARLVFDTVCEAASDPRVQIGTVVIIGGIAMVAALGPGGAVIFIAL